ncbi:hypothetical protein OFN30_33055, partial [Escherichia coli]|nr:hypothetical protein [Escherichia coli]
IFFNLSISLVKSVTDLSAIDFVIFPYSIQFIYQSVTRKPYHGFQLSTAGIFTFLICPRRMTYPH